MTQKLRQLTARFDALSLRERRMVALAVLFGGGLLGYSLLVDPHLTRQATMSKRITQAKSSSAGIEAQLTVMQAQLKDPDAANRAALQQAKSRMAALDSKLRGLEGSLVSPEKMQGFLQSLLSKNRNLELLALRTLPLAPLLAPQVEEKKAEDKKAEDKKNDAKKSEAKPAAAAVPNIYKHGVEIRIAGSYNDLLIYLTELERMPSRIIWNRIVLTVEQYPRCVLTLTLYTLSLDKQWLVV